MNKNEKRVLVFGGPTGAGETTITKKIIERFPHFRKLVAATTRNMRTGEQNKIDYYFMSKEEFLNGIEKGDIIEHTYIENRDTYYGSYKPDLDKKIDAGLNVIVNVDIVGAKYFKENNNATTIFIRPESLNELKGRFTKRDPHISPEEIEKRVQNAQEEVKNEMSFYDYVVINADGKLEAAIEDIIDILKKENYSLS
jgi:guanylate kinase